MRPLAILFALGMIFIQQPTEQEHVYDCQWIRKELRENFLPKMKALALEQRKLERRMDKLLQDAGELGSTDARRFSQKQGIDRNFDEIEKLWREVRRLQAKKAEPKPSPIKTRRK